MEEIKLLKRSTLFSFAEGFEGEQRDTGFTTFSCFCKSCHTLLQPSQDREWQPTSDMFIFAGACNQFSTYTMSTPEEMS